MVGNACHDSPDLNKVLAGAQLPALPQSAVRLLELSRDPSHGTAEFGAAIEADPGLAGQVLRFVNSAYFGFCREVSSVKQGITLVGTRTIKNFALWSAVFSVLPNPKCGPLNLKILWQDSLRRALFARAMAKALGTRETEDVFAAGLLQDMAIPLLAKGSPAVYVKLLSARADGATRLSELEQQAYGWNHAQAAGIMARQWNLPEELASLVENHTKVEQWAKDPKREAARLAVAMSALLPSAADPFWRECPLMEGYYDKAVGSGRPMLAQLLEQVDGEFSEFAPLLRLSEPGKTLDECLQEVTASS